MQYTISFKNPLTHIIDISLILDNPGTVTDFQLPAWRPGRYELSNYAQNIYKVVARSGDGSSVNIYKISKDKWRIDPIGSDGIIIDYSYYANQMDAGGSVLNEEMLYINFINCLLYPLKKEDDSCTVTLELPTQWQLASSLPFDQNFEIKAESYFQLVDSPIMAAADLTQWQWKVDDWKFSLWFRGEIPLKRGKVIEHFSAFIKEQVKMMGQAHSEPYHFIYFFPDYRFHHGVEHANSTVIALGPRENLAGDEDLYREFLSISSHELFHSWNITRLKPKEFIPFDFSKEIYFETGFIAEGFTTYYGDLFLVRSGVFSVEQYLKELNRLLKKHFENFGRHNLSVAESSFDLWLDGYKPGIPNRKVSIYIKGAIIALMADLQIRIQTDHNKSLDDVIRYLWKEFYEKQKGYSIQDIKASIEHISNVSWAEFFEDYVYGTTPVENLLSGLLEPFGLELQEKNATFFWECAFGFRIDPDTKKVIKIEPLSPAEKILSQDDIINTMNGKETVDFIADNNSVKQLDLLISRGGKDLKVTLSKGSRSYFRIFEIVMKKNLTKEEKESCKSWISQDANQI